MYARNDGRCPQRLDDSESKNLYSPIGAICARFSASARSSRSRWRSLLGSWCSPKPRVRGAYSSGRPSSTASLESSDGETARCCNCRRLFAELPLPNIFLIPRNALPARLPPVASSVGAWGASVAIIAAAADPRSYCGWSVAYSSRSASYPSLPVSDSSVLCRVMTAFSGVGVSNSGGRGSGGRGGRGLKISSAYWIRSERRISSCKICRLCAFLRVSLRRSHAHHRHAGSYHLSCAAGEFPGSNLHRSVGRTLARGRGDP